jgi:hypothetical protein
MHRRIHKKTWRGMDDTPEACWRRSSRHASERAYRKSSRSTPLPPFCTAEAAQCFVTHFPYKLRSASSLGAHRWTVLLEKMDGWCRMLAYKSPRIFILTGSNDNCRCLGLVTWLQNSAQWHLLCSSISRVSCGRQQRKAFRTGTIPVHSS